MCVHNNPQGRELMQSEKRVPLPLLESNQFPEEQQRTLERLQKEPRFVSLVLRHQFKPDTLNLENTRPLIRLYTNYPDVADILFSDGTKQVIKRIILDNPLVLPRELVKNSLVVKDKTSQHDDDGRASKTDREKVLGGGTKLIDNRGDRHTIL
jgi:hypothetical protein